MNAEAVFREKFLAFSHSRDERSAVIDAACLLVHELRAQGLPPEKVVVQVKTVLRGLRPKDAPDREFEEEIVLTCIKDYFRPTNGLQ